MRQAVQQSRRHPFPLEDRTPFPERQVARDQQARAFVPVGEDLEEQLRPGPAERQITKFIDDQQVEPFEGGEQAVEPVLLLRRLQFRDQVRCGRELHA